MHWDSDVWHPIWVLHRAYFSTFSCKPRLNLKWLQFRLYAVSELHTPSVCMWFFVCLKMIWMYEDGFQLTVLYPPDPPRMWATLHNSTSTQILHNSTSTQILCPSTSTQIICPSTSIKILRPRRQIRSCARNEQQKSLRQERVSWIQDLGSGGADFGCPPGNTAWYENISSLGGVLYTARFEHTLKACRIRTHS